MGPTDTGRGRIKRRNVGRRTAILTDPLSDPHVHVIIKAALFRRPPPAQNANQSSTSVLVQLTFRPHTQE